MSTREVELSGGAPWGFRMHGGADHNQPLRISRVNPGRKASLSGIREGDVITSINGQQTKNMSNADAHAMLRSAGPVLRLGLNEDREMSPRRRSIGKASELKRPSQLITGFGNEIATPQAPVYATIRTVNSPKKQSQPQSPGLSSIPLVKSAAFPEEPLKFHPTNPFFTTLPSNCSSASKLPVPNGRVPQPSLDKIRYNKSLFINGSQPDLNTSVFTNTDSQVNTVSSSNGNTKYNSIPKISISNVETHETRENENNPFNSGANKMNENVYHESKNPNENKDSIHNSKSDSDFYSGHEALKKSIITEHNISQIEEIKTTKKVILNGSSNFENNTTDRIHFRSSDNIRSDLDQAHQSPKNDIPTMSAEMKSPRSYSNGFSKQFSLPNEADSRLHEEFTDRQQSTESFKNIRFNADTPSTKNVDIQPSVRSPRAETVAPSKPVWRPGAPPAPVRSESPSANSGAPPPPPPPVWSPSNTASPQPQRKTFRPVHFEESPPTRRKASADQNGCTSGSESEGRLKTSHSAPVTGLNTLGLSGSSRLPRAQNPTVTLLQKAREGLLSQTTNYIKQERDARLPRDRPSPPKGDPVYALRKEYDASEGEAGRRNDRDGRKMSDAHKKIEGIGPTTKDGMPVTLRSEVKDPSRWYKKMYDTIHKNKYDDDYVTIRYKNRRGETIQRPSSNRSQYAYFDPRSGYLSEPEGRFSRLASSTWSDAYDSDVASGPRRRTASVQEDRRNDVESPYPPNKYSTLASARASQEVYKGQPGRIENYVPGRSSVIDKEAKQWWDEVMDIFDGWLDDNTPLPPYTTFLARAIQKSQNMSNSSLPQASPKEKKDITSTILSKSNMARALKESGYESDSTLIFRRREETDGPLSPAERRAAYRDLQAGGEPPLRGFRSPAPPRQDDSQIEYIPISKTLTKIRVHKISPHIREVVCYPVTRIENDRLHEERQPGPDLQNDSKELPPPPPRRVSSMNSRTLKLVTSTKPNSKSRTLQASKDQSNVDFLKNKITNKLNRQNTHIILKRGPSTITSVPINSRAMSTSAPPAINRSKLPNNYHATQKNNTKFPKQFGTSSFSSPRKIMPPNNYATTGIDKFGDQLKSIIIEGGVGRRTPISSILDKVTSIDKLWSSQKRNERIDITKLKSKNVLMTTTLKNKQMKTSAVPQTKMPLVMKQYPPVTHKSRDMLRTSEKIQRIKSLNQHTKSVPCLLKQDGKPFKSGICKTTVTSKSTSNLIPSNVSKIQNNRPVKTAVITNLKKKKSVTLAKPPRILSAEKNQNMKNIKCVEQNIKENSPKKSTLKRPINDLTKYYKSSNQFGNDLNKTINYNSCKKQKGEINDLSNALDSVSPNTFFQQLFLRNIEALSSREIEKQNSVSLVSEKTKLFQSLPDRNINYSNSNSLNTYLINRKPVSLSRFVMWDRNPSPISLQKPRSISWPGKMDGEIRKFDSLNMQGSYMGSVTSLYSFRSRSEPPGHKLYFSQTSRPVSPTVIFHKKSPQRLVSPPKQKVLQYSKMPQANSLNKDTFSTLSIIKSPTRKTVPTTIKSSFEDSENKLPCLYFSQSSRSVSPLDNRSTCFSRSQSTSPVSIRSPSYRRIYLSRNQNKTDKINKRETRTHSADNKCNKANFKNMSRVSSEPNLYSDDPDYDEYIRDIQSTKSRSERFRELNQYYAYLERVAELEKATYNNEVMIRKKDEEIIDFDRWKKIRAIERAEEELNNLYDKLKKAQRYNDVLFYPRDVKDFRWKFDSERGLKIKEKSVEDLKDKFQQKCSNDYGSLDLQKSTDTYKPLWRAKSVAETAFDINNKKENRKERGQPIRPSFVLQDDSFQDLRKRIGIGNRLWSSLSIDQVTALKDQLNAIYSKELESKTSIKNEEDKYAIEINNNMKTKNPNLYVRCSSLGTPRTISSAIASETLSKSESIAAINYNKHPEKEMKNNVNKMQMSLSESEKKIISQNISKEVLNKLQKDNLTLKNEMDNSVQCNKNDNHTRENIHSNTNEQTSYINSIKPRHIIYTKENTLSNQSSASETDTGSSDVSTKTVISKENKIEVKKKVEYFESVKNVINTQPKTVFHARENSDDQKSDDMIKNNKLVEEHEKSVDHNTIFQSQSCTNFKELFGESVKSNFFSLPLKTANSRSPSPYSDVHERDRRTPDTLPYSSNETICRSHSPSPDQERAWRTYLKFTRGGEVRRLARRFDSPSSVGAVLRRHRSDPEIARNVYKNNWFTIEGEPSYREKCKALTVARVPLRPTNRFMPHIDIISKLAALRKRPTTRSRSAEEAIECRPGEVERIRRKFETMSLLGQIYSSAPDIRELHEIPFLAGPWIAHQYPKPSDNNRSIENPDKFVSGRMSPIKKDIKRAITKQSLNLSSILKNEPLSQQAFDPIVHRPASRYEPPRAPPRPPPAAWPYRLAPYVLASSAPSRHTVTFQESDSAPEPPRRTTYGSYSDTESPNRRYVESDVNIHYRCPVRHDPLPLVPERELARQQAEHMKSLYREQKRNKYLQDNNIHPMDIEAFEASIKELQDAQSRRHQDNFMPSQKSVIPLNRYDEAEKIVARALYTFNGQTSRELSFRKGDFINVRRQIDANWYEGEIHGRIGLFPYNYVELLKGDGARSPKKPTIIEGRAKAKFDFTAQTNLELPLKKGEIVILIRRIDHNWWEGRNASKTGIFPDSYITVLQEPSQSKPEPQPILSTDKPVASPAAHGLLNGSDKRSMGTHSYTPQPNSPALANAPPATQPLTGYGKSKAQGSASERGYGPPAGAGVDLNNTEPLYVDTNAEAIPYRAMYKYRPQNPDELELNEGDTVYVLEKCDDGWYVGSSQRTGRFGTFPGNYVERI